MKVICENFLFIIYFIYFLNKYSFEQWYCNGLYYINSTYGIIRDHTDSLNKTLYQNYEVNVKCYWVIQPIIEPVKSYSGPYYITLLFKKLDLEFNFDFVTIYNGNKFNNSNPEIIFRGTGYRTPEYPIFSSYSFFFNNSSLSNNFQPPIVTVEFYSDPLIVYRGITILFSAIPCINGCINGYCFNGSCICYGGWTGEICNISTCTNDCGVRGKCINNTCICQPGAYGDDCTKVYCDEITTLIADSGNFSSKNKPSGEINGYGDYLPKTNCIWKILPTTVINNTNINNYSLILIFLKMDTNVNTDFIYIYDSNNIGTGNLIGVYSGGTIPPPTVSTTGVMSIQFISNSWLPRSGFVVSYELKTCMGGCYHGWCYQGNCICELGWNGTFCNESFCLSNCSFPNGRCINSLCVCNSGYIGIDCGICNNSNCQYIKNNNQNILEFQSTNETINISFDATINQTIQWLISPLNKFADSIVIFFQKYQYGTSNLNFTTIISIYDGNTSIETPLIAKFFGNGIFQPIISSSSSLFITIEHIITNNSSVNNNIEFISIEATYYSISCNNSCNGNGICSFNSICICNLGFVGDDCSQTICYNNCSNHGICNKSKCDCELGYYGPFCFSNFCSGFVNVNLLSGNISDHNYTFGGSQYLPNSFCQWLIQIPNGTIRFQIDNRDAIVQVFDGPNNKTKELIDSQGSFLPLPIQSSNSSLLVQFIVGPSASYSGFTFSFYSDFLCVPQCIDGFCYNGICICNAGKTGISCNESVTPELLSFDNPIISSVESWNWKYYQINLTEIIGELSFYFNDMFYAGFPIFFETFNKLPNLFSNPLFYFYGNYFNIENPSLGLWYIGIYGSKTESSNLSYYIINITRQCILNCSNNGNCLNYLTCNCSIGYYGNSCQYVNCTEIPTILSCQGKNFTCNPPCQNGGICLENNQCNCDKTGGFFGKDCSEYMCMFSCGNGQCVGPNLCTCPNGNQYSPNCPVNNTYHNNTIITVENFYFSNGFILEMILGFIGILFVIVAAIMYLRSRRNFHHFIVVPSMIGAAGFDETHS